MPAERYLTNEIASIEIYGRMGKMSAKVANLSMSGMRLELTRSELLPKSGDVIRVVVALKTLGKSYNLDAQIIWTKALALGVQFLKPNELVTRMMNK